MGTVIVISLIFLVMDVMVVGIFYAVYGRKWKYENGMLLCVHIPASAAEGEEIRNFMEDLKKRTRRFYLWNGIAGVLVCIPSLWYISIFMILWTVWLLEFCTGAIGLVCISNRRLYEMKVKNGWIGSGGSRILAVDTKAAALSGKKGIRAWWHILPLGLVLSTLLLPGVRTYLTSEDGGSGILVSTLLISVTLMILHIVLARMGNRVYSEDSEVNLAVNSLEKRTWSWIMFLSSLVNAAAYLPMAHMMSEQGSVGGTGYALWGAFGCLSAVIIIGGLLWLARKKRQIISADTQPVYIDDDVYWKNGWYSNPNDRRLLVQDRICSVNFSSNMAKPAARIFTAVVVAACAALLIWMCVMFVKIDFTPTELRITDQRVEITSSLWDTTLERDAIENVELIDELPDDDFRRTNGLDDGRNLIGQFEGKQSGECRLYVRLGIAPILKIETDNLTVFINSSTEGEVQMWYEELHGRTG